jgi:hypothetical protein
MESAARDSLRLRFQEGKSAAAQAIASIRRITIVTLRACLEFS